MTKSLVFLFSFSFCIQAFATGVVESLRVQADADERVQQEKLLATEILVSQTEEKALDHLKNLIVKYKNTSMEASMRFRLSELYMNRAKSARFIEQIASNEDDVISFLPSQIKSLKEKNMVKEAIKHYSLIESRFPKFAEIDQVVFNKAFAQLQIGEKDKAEMSFIRLLKKYKRSRLRPDAFLAVGEINFNKRNFKRALAYFKQVKKYKKSRVYPYGLYKGAWCYHNLDGYEQAIGELEKVIYYGAKVEKLGLDQRMDLRVEAISDMALFYSASRPAQGAADYFIKLAGNKDPIPAIRKLASIFEKHGKDVKQELVLVDLINKFKTQKDRVFFFRDLTQNLNRQMKYRKSANTLWSFYKTCKSVMEKNPELEEDYCQLGVNKISKRLSLRWLKIYKENKKNLIMASVSEDAFRVHFADQKPRDENSKMRYLFAEHLFDLKKFLESSSEYDLVGDSAKDDKRRHQARYASIFAYDLAFQSKFKGDSIKRFRELSGKYMKDFPEGERYLDVGFKLALFDYKNKDYNLAGPLFLELGDKYYKLPRGKKSQDLYLDILNAQKDYIALQANTKKWKATETDPERSNNLQKIHEQAFFSEVALLEKKKDYRQALARYNKFTDENSSSDLVDEARWNKIDLHFKLKEYDETAKSYISFYQLHPKSKNSVPGLVKAVEIYEMMAEPEKAFEVSEMLKEANPKDRFRWNYLSATYLKASGRYEEAAKRFNYISKFLSEFRQASIDELFNLQDQLLNKSDWYQSELVKLFSSKKRSIASLAVRTYGKGLYQSDAERPLAKFIATHKWNKGVDPDKRAIFHYYDGLRKEKWFLDFKVDDKSMDSIVSGIQNKTKKLDRAQRAYQRALEDMDPKIIVKSLLGLSRSYQGFIADIKKINAPATFSKEEAEALKQELDNIVMPFEEKSAEALDQALELVNKAKLKDGSIRKIKDLYDVVNLDIKEVYPLSLNVPKATGPRGI